MNPHDSFHVRQHLFSATQEEEVVIIRMVPDPLPEMIHIPPKEGFLNFMDEVSRAEDVKVVVLFGPNADCGRSSYVRFMNDLRAGRLGITDIERMCNAVNQMVMKLAGLNKVVVYANGGSIIPMFFNMGLASDYRILSSTAVIQNPATEFGLIPKGGGAYLLTKMLGLTLASQILMADEDISAEKAMEWHMVNEIVPPEQLETRAMEKGRQFAAKPVQALTGIKKLLHFCINDLSSCLEYETEVLRQLVRSGALEDK